MKTVLEILARELGKGTFDQTCTADERTAIRKFLNTYNTDKEDYRDFGTANGWIETPALIKYCNILKHEVTKKGIGRCLTEVRCDICRYIYKIDSSD